MYENTYELVRSNELELNKLFTELADWEECLKDTSLYHAPYP